MLKGISKLKREMIVKKKLDPECIETEKLYVGNMEYLSNEYNDFGVAVVKTQMKYIFIKKEENLYEEIFTKLQLKELKSLEYSTFEERYIVDKQLLIDVIPNINNEIHLYALLQILEEINFGELIES